MLLLCVLMGVLVSLVLALQTGVSTSTRLLTWLVATLTAYLAAHASVVIGARRAAWLDWALSLPMLFGPLLYFHVASSTGSLLRFGLGVIGHAAPFALHALIMLACARDEAASCQPWCDAWLEHVSALLLLGYTWAAAERLARYRARAASLGALGAVRDRILRLGTLLVAFAATALLTAPIAWPVTLDTCAPEWRGTGPLGVMLAILWLWISVWLWPQTLRTGPRRVPPT